MMKKIYIRRKEIMSNEEIIILLKKENIYKWQVAKKLGIHETTFIKWFREPLTKEQQLQVLSTIEKIKLERLK